MTIDRRPPPTDSPLPMGVGVGVGVMVIFSGPPSAVKLRNDNPHQKISVDLRRLADITGDPS
jgi:hypothetical protein